MSFSLRILDIAELELQTALCWYEGIYPKLANELKLHIKKTIQHILDNPLAYPIVSKHVRRARIPHFPYVILFTILERTIVVIAIFHTKRSPLAWESRLPIH